MAQWYSLEGLAARVGRESQAVSVVREGFKKAFGKALAVMGRGGEVNDHFDGALVSKEAAVQFILLKWTAGASVRHDVASEYECRRFSQATPAYI